jgi:hypothetical protein
MPPSYCSATVMSKDRQKSIRAIAHDAHKSVTTTSPKKLRRLMSDGSIKRDLYLSINIQKMKSTNRFVVGPAKRYASLKNETDISGASAVLEKKSSTESEESSKNSGDEMEIHRGCYT